MLHALRKPMRLALVLVFGAVASTVALAQPGHAKGKGAREAGEPWEKGKGKGSAKHFAPRHRDYVREYYAEEFRSGHCPPGLAKKRNGCLPPGQAKKWRMGRPLPADVVVYEVPAPLVARIGPPPAGYRYVRVGADILMIAIGTSMVVDALSDLSRIR